MVDVGDEFDGEFVLFTGRLTLEIGILNRVHMLGDGILVGRLGLVLGKQGLVGGDGAGGFAVAEEGRVSYILLDPVGGFHVLLLGRRFVRRDGGRSQSVCGCRMVLHWR